DRSLEQVARPEQERAARRAVEGRAGRGRGGGDRRRRRRRHGRGGGDRRRRRRRHGRGGGDRRRRRRRHGRGGGRPGVLLRRDTQQIPPPNLELLLAELVVQERVPFLELLPALDLVAQQVVGMVLGTGILPVLVGRCAQLSRPTDVDLDRLELRLHRDGRAVRAVLLAIVLSA